MGDYLVAAYIYIYIVFLYIANYVNYAHTPTTHIYIYIYIERERDRERAELSNGQVYKGSILDLSLYFSAKWKLLGSVYHLSM